VVKSLSEANAKMTKTNIVKCQKCGKLALAKAKQKTKTCPYCGATINLQTAKTIARAETAEKASEILRNIKIRKGISE
jgi:uncharacterized Zn finger protein (UPF0148 family)